MSHPLAFRLVLLVALAAPALFGGCARSGTASPARSSSQSRDPITAEEISQALGRVNTAYEVIERQRPSWLRMRGPSTIRAEEDKGIVVFLDGMRLGGLEELHRISAAIVLHIAFLRSGDATIKYGTGYPHGVIEVGTRH